MLLTGMHSILDHDSVQHGSIIAVDWLVCQMASPVTCDTIIFMDEFSMLNDHT